MSVSEPKSVRTDPVPEIKYLPHQVAFFKDARKDWNSTLANDKPWKVWWKTGAVLLMARDAIMHELGLNKPYGSTYTIAMGRVVNQFQGLQATKQASYILWLRSDPEREQICEMLREQMTPAQRSRINDPNSMAKRVRAYMREGEAKQRRKPTPPAQRVRELEAELAAVHENPVPLIAHWVEASSVHTVARVLYAIDAAMARELADEIIRRDGEG